MENSPTLDTISASFQNVSQWHQTLCNRVIYSTEKYQKYQIVLIKLCQVLKQKCEQGLPSAVDH